MRLYYQSPLPQRPPMQRSAPLMYRPPNSRNNYHYQYGAGYPTVHPYEQNSDFYRHHALTSHPHEAYNLYNNQATNSYAQVSLPPLTPPRQRTLTPPPPNVIFLQPSSPRKSIAKTQEPSTPEYIYEVHENDVLCGRGAPSQYQAGNKFFREIVERFQSSYIAARRIDKPEIATHVVDMVRDRGGRFLKRIKVQGVGPSGHFCWQDIGDQRAYEKACQALREGQPEIRRKLAAKEIAAAALCSINNSVYPSYQYHTPISHDTSSSRSVEHRDDGSHIPTMADLRCERE